MHQITLGKTGLVIEKNGFGCLPIQRISEQDAVKLGIQALLRDRIIQTYNHYSAKGYCPIYGLENAESMYLQYHALGGNGAITKLLEALRELPTESKEDK